MLIFLFRGNWQFHRHNYRTVLQRREEDSLFYKGLSHLWYSGQRVHKRSVCAQVQFLVLVRAHHFSHESVWPSYLGHVHETLLYTSLLLSIYAYILHRQLQYCAASPLS